MAFIIGKYKTWFERAMNYAGFANFFMVLYLFLTSAPFSIAWYYWLIAGFIAIVIIIFIDIKIIYPQSLGYVFGKNPEWKRMNEKLDRLEQKIDALSDVKTR